MSTQTDFFKFINKAVVEDNDLVSHTWMYGDEKMKPTKGKFFIPETHMKEFRMLYSRAILEGIEIKLSEKPYGDKIRVFFDVDGSQRIDYIISDLYIYIKNNFNPINNLKIVSVQNTLKENKYHLYAFQEEGQKLTSLSIKKHYLELMTKKMKEKYEEIDITKALRMVYSSKKEGIDQGIYAPENKITTKILKKYSIISTIEDCKLSPTFEYEQQAIKIIEDSLKTKNKKATVEFTDENSVERLNFILPILQKYGYFDEYTSWFSLVVICKKYGFPYEELDRLCSLSENYVYGCIDSIYDDSNTSNMRNNKGYTIATAQYYLNICDPEAYKEYKNQFFSSKYGGGWLSKTILSEMWNDQLGHSRVYLEIVEDNVVLVDSKKWNGYLWDDNVKLWTPVVKEGIILHIANTLENIAKILVKKTETSIEEANNGDKKDEKVQREKDKILKSYKLILKNTRTKSHNANVFDFVKHKLLDMSFTKKINNSSMLFPLKYGNVVNLQTKEVRVREKEDLFSFECNVELGDKDNEKVKQFFNSIMSDQEDRVKYLKQILGYCLSGDIKARRFFIFTGEGSNGKSVLTDIMDEIMGEYSNVVSKTIFIQGGRNEDRHAVRCTPELCPLSTGCRIAYCSEIGMDGKLNDELLKKLTGDTFIDCNPKGKDPFKFKMYAKLVLLTNFEPQFNSKDKALLERFTIIPFEERFTIEPKGNERQRNTAFIEDLIKNHINDIFSFLLEGSIDYWKHRQFDIPEHFKNKKQEIEEDNDDLGDFLSAKTARKIGKSVQILQLYGAYTSWCRYNNIDPYGRKTLVTEIIKRGYKRGKNAKNCVTIEGIEIQDDENDFS